MTAPLPYSHEWWLQQPPEDFADIVRRFHQEKDKLSPLVRRQLEKRLPPLDVATKIDADMARILKG